MDLIFKLYNDKPSKIGVRYVYEYQALKEYELMVTRYRGEVFSVELEFNKDKVNMTLKSDDSGAKVLYKDLEFKQDQLKKFQSFFKGGMPLEFVHVFTRSNTLFVAKPYKLAEFFKVSSFEIINLAGQAF